MPNVSAVPGQRTCFVIMGFGKKTDFESGRTLDLDKSYFNIIKPAAESAGLTCIRADEIVHTGLIDVPMYEQLLDADVVVADLSTSNKNAYYELGIRHALRPFSTVVIAEDGSKIPFDINHVVVRQYRHLGEDIGYDEALKFQKLLREAIQTVLSKTPPDGDSPVYRFIEGLSPPARARVHSSMTGPVRGSATEAGAAPEPGATHSVMMRQVAEMEQAGNLKGAKDLLAAVRLMRSAQNPELGEDPYILQRLALLTYKSKDPDEKTALLEAHRLLNLLNPATSNDPETLGLWQAVHKRLWFIDRDRTFLDEAIRASERGFYLRNDYYNGINLAFLLNERAALPDANPADAITDFVHARRVRDEVLKICDAWLRSRTPPQGEDAVPEAVAQYEADRYWVLATRAEAVIGRGDDALGQRLLDEAVAMAPKTWMADSTLSQVEKLRALLADSPLKHLAAPAAPPS
jgi:hypothetical protein